MNILPEVMERRPAERGEIQLQKRNQHYEIIYNGSFLMATYNGASERMLVSAAFDICKKPNHVLIGGLGVGFSFTGFLMRE